MSRNIFVVILLSMLFTVTVFAQNDTLDMKIPVFKSVTYYAAAIPGEDIYAIPQSIANNQYYRESLRLNSLAYETFDYGDYTAAAGLAQEAYRYALLSDEYVAFQLINENERMLNWAYFNGIGALFPSAYSESQAYYEASLYSLTDNKWNESISFSINSIEILASLELPEGVEPIPIEGILNQQGSQTAGKTADGTSTVSQTAGGTSAGETAASGTQTVNQTAGGSVSQPDTSMSGTAGISPAGELSYLGSDRGISTTAAATAVRTAPLPSQYTVRTWAVERDCLWTIAGYPWVFNDPRRWPELYEANRSRMPQPNNPDLIYPGFIINIPSNRGEYRQGMWDPNADYGF